MNQTQTQSRLQEDGQQEALQTVLRLPPDIKSKAAAFLGISDPKKLFNVLRNVWKQTKGQPDLTDQEMFTGISLVARFELDPVAREVYVSRDKQGRLMTIVGIDGWVKILDRTEHYDGFEQQLGFDAKEEQLQWVETVIYSNTRSHPVRYRAYAKEYAELGGFMASKIPWHMLRLFSLRHAARLFTPLGANVVTQEEADYILSRQDDYEPEPAEQPKTRTEAVKQRLQPKPQQEPGAEVEANEPEEPHGFEPDEDVIESLIEAAIAEIQSKLKPETVRQACEEALERLDGEIKDDEEFQQARARLEAARDERIAALGDGLFDKGHAQAE